MSKQELVMACRKCDKDIQNNEVNDLCNRGWMIAVRCPHCGNFDYPRFRQEYEIRCEGKVFPVEFMHIRDEDEYGDILARGGVTVAFLFNGDISIKTKQFIRGLLIKRLEEDPTQKTLCLSGPGNYTVYAAVAYCSPKDVYSKERGRAISFGRLVSFMCKR
jgi:hypothetical protein